MKIAIIGYSGSGKSTLAQSLGAHYGAQVLHLDSVYWLANWRERDEAECRRIVSDFLDAHDAWVVDGNYLKLCCDRRMEEADQIVILLFNRFVCLHRACRRYRRYRGQSRPDMAEGCAEKLDAEFARWILFDGRTGKRRARYRELAAQYADKAVVLKNQRELDAFIQSL